MSDRFDSPTADCVPVDRIAEVQARDETDSAHRHLEECPRCRAISRELATFLAGPETVDPAAVERLESVLAGEILGESHSSVIPAADRFRGWWKPALALAATVLVIAVAVDRIQEPDLEGPPLLRGAESDATVFHGPTEVTFEGGDEGGAIVFHWEAQPGADAYRVEIFDDAFESVRTLPAADGNTLRWTPDLEDFGARTWLWRVIALDRGDPVRRSSPRPLDPAGAEASPR